MITLLIVVGAVVVVGVGTLLSNIFIEVEVFQSVGQIEAVLHIRALFGLIRIRKHLHELHAKMTKEGPAMGASIHDQAKVAAGQPSAAEMAPSGKARERVLTAEEVWRFVRNWRAWLTLSRRLGPKLRALLAHIDMSVFKLDIRVGVGDPVATGCLVGSLWSVVGFMTGSVASMVNLTAVPDLVVNPDFTGQSLQLNGRCIGRLRVGYAMLGAIQMLGIWRRFRASHDLTSP